jgi:hypothetical protein
MGADFQQAQFEYLEQADRAGADDHGVGLDGAGKAAVGGDVARFRGKGHHVAGGH